MIDRHVRRRNIILGGVNDSRHLPLRKNFNLIKLGREKREVREGMYIEAAQAEAKV